MPDRDKARAAGSQTIAVLRRYFAASWGARLEHILTNFVLALFEYPNATLLHIPKMLLDPDGFEHGLQIRLELRRAQIAGGAAHQGQGVDREVWVKGHWHAITAGEAGEILQGVAAFGRDADR